MIPGEAMSLTGDSGVMEKTFIMECFSRPVDADELSDVPNAKGVAATAAANCGVSCRDCHRGYRCGPPPHMHDHVQEFGRVDRNQNKPAGFNRYEVHSDFKSVLSMFVRALQQPDKQVRDKAVEDFYTTITFLFCPQECYHIMMERHFENPDVVVEKKPCEEYCSYCTDGHKEITGLFHKDKLANVLLSKFFTSNAMAPDAFIKYLKEEKLRFFADGNIPDKHVGPIHGVAIQLLCKRSIVPYIDEKYKHLIGTEDLNTSHVLLKGGISRDNDGLQVPVLNTDNAWVGLNCV